MKDLILKLIVKVPFINKAIEDALERARQETRDIERPKAFQLAQKDILETMKDDIDEKAEELAKEKLMKFLSPVDTRFIMTINKAKQLEIGGEVADIGRIGALATEAELLLQSDLWNILYNSPKELAQRALFVEGGSMEQLVKGRAMLHTLETQKNIIDILISVKK